MLVPASPCPPPASAPAEPVTVCWRNLKIRPVARNTRVLSLKGCAMHLRDKPELGKLNSEDVYEGGGSSERRH